MEKESQRDEAVVLGEATATETPVDDLDTVVRTWFCPVWHVPPFCGGVGCALLLLRTSCLQSSPLSASSLSLWHFVMEMQDAGHR